MVLRGVLRDCFLDCVCPKGISMPEDTFPCVLCDNILSSKEELQDHFRKHANKEIDSKGHARKAAVRKTEETSSTSSVGAATSGKSGKSDVVCDVCNMQFDTVTLAIQHKFKKHPDSAIKHFCPHCGKQFPLKVNRDKHLLTHAGLTPTKLFPCQECGVVFYNADAQSFHFKSTHKRIVAIFQPIATPPPSKKIRVNNAGEAQSVYYCHLCGFEYIVKFNLQKHLEKQHQEKEQGDTPKEVIKCTTCDALFYNKRAYENHNMYHKPGDLYVTSEEQRLQTVTRVDQDFDIRRVQNAADKFIPVYRPRRSKSTLSDIKSLPTKGTAKRKKHKKASDGNSSDSSREDSDEQKSFPVKKTKCEN